MPNVLQGRVPAGELQTDVGAFGSASPVSRVGFAGQGKRSFWATKLTSASWARTNLWRVASALTLTTALRSKIFIATNAAAATRTTIARSTKVWPDWRASQRMPLLVRTRTQAGARHNI